MPITTKVVVSSNLVLGEVYSTQHYVIKFVSDLRQVSGFLQVLCVIKFVNDVRQVSGFLQVLCVIKFVSDLRQVSGFLQVLCVIKFVSDLRQVGGFLWVLHGFLRFSTGTPKPDKKENETEVK